MDTTKSLNRAVLESLAGGCNFDELLTRAEAACGCPIIVLDMHLNCIGHSAGAISAQLLGSVPDLLSGWLHSLNMSDLRRFLSGELCGIIARQEGESIFLQCAVKTGITHSLVAVSAPESLRGSAEEVVRLISRVYGTYYLSGRDVSLGVDSLRSGLASALLNEDSRSGSLFSTVYGVDFPTLFNLRGKYIMLEIHSTEARVCLSALRKTAEQLEAAFPNAYSVITESGVCAILCRVGDEMESTWRELEEFALRGEFSCGVSLPFRDISQRYRYKQQAYTAWELAGGTSAPVGVYRADRMICEIIAHDVCESLGADVLILSDIVALAQLDAERHTNYLKTLSAWLENGCHISSTARQLFLDRSTLKYRLEKIREKLSCDLEGDAALWSMKLSLMVWKYGPGSKDIQVRCHE